MAGSNYASALVHLCSDQLNPQLTVGRALLLLSILVSNLIASISATTTLTDSAYEVFKSPVYPRLPQGIRFFRDAPVHGPVVAIQVWYNDRRVHGFQTRFLDKYQSPIHGHAVGNTSTVTFDPEAGDFFSFTGPHFAALSKDGTAGAVLLLIARGTKSETSPGTGISFFGGALNTAAVGGSTPGVIVGLTGTADATGITQIGYIIEARQLSFKQYAGNPNSLQHWHREAVVRSSEVPRLPSGLRPFEIAGSGEHGEVVKVQLWVSEAQGVLGFRPSFQDGYTSPVVGYASGQSITFHFDPKTNPLVAVGGRGLKDFVSNTTGEYQLAALVLFEGGSSPPILTPLLGVPRALTYSDSANGKIVGFFGQIGHSSIVQLGVRVISPANGLLISSGPFPRLGPQPALQFDHTGDNKGVSKIDVYYDNHVGLRGIQFTYVTHQRFEYTTPVYGQKQPGFHKQVQFNYVDNPLVNVGLYVGNLLAGTGEVGIIGLTFHTRTGDIVGNFGAWSVSSFNLTDGSTRVVGFYGQANTVVNSLGVYTAPL